MSFHYPRRVKDLPTLELESEDEYKTPQKAAERSEAATKAAQLQQSNKENEAGSSNTSNSFMGSSTKSNSAFFNMRNYPKRSCELPTLESDSEEEADIRNDNLNCAILNDSFIMSPARMGEMSMLLKTPCASAVKSKLSDPNASSSFVSCFDRMALVTENDKENANNSLNKLLPAAASTAQKQNPSLTTSISALQPIPEDVKLPAEAAHRHQPEPTQPPTKRKDLETPFKPGTEAEFATPQIRSFSVQRRPQDLCSTQSQKTRSAIVNEFRSQKVLFQTPMSLTARPPIACMPNDSISLSLCDTINEAADTPTTAEKSAHMPEQQHNAKAKSKKSLEGAFNAIEKPAEQVKETLEDEKSEQSKVSQPTHTASGKETVLHINDTGYAILKKLGSGGSSSVYLARRNDNGKECALKVVDLRGDPIVVEGYLNETKLLAKLQGNVCVVALHEYQLLQKESKLYLVMEKGDSDLHKILQTYTTHIPLYLLMNYLYQMLQAVNYIHQNGVIHSDLKPANFLMVSGRLKLIDFGIASNIAIDSTSIIKFSQAGTFNYISPEALTDTSTGTSPMRNNQPKIKISTKSDVWSLGCILYLLLYKKTPFSHIKNIYAKISAISNPTNNIEYPALPMFYPAMLVHMVKNCLQHNPKKRPSCAELLQYPFHMIIPIQNLAVPISKP